MVSFRGNFAAQTNVNGHGHGQARSALALVPAQLGPLPVPAAPRGPRAMVRLANGPARPPAQGHHRGPHGQQHRGAHHGAPVPKGSREHHLNNAGTHVEAITWLMRQRGCSLEEARDAYWSARQALNVPDTAAAPRMPVHAPAVPVPAHVYVGVGLPYEDRVRTVPNSPERASVTVSASPTLSAEAPDFVPQSAARAATADPVVVVERAPSPSPAARKDSGAEVSEEDEEDDSTEEDKSTEEDESIKEDDEAAAVEIEETALPPSLAELLHDFTPEGAPTWANSTTEHCPIAPPKLKKYRPLSPPSPRPARTCMPSLAPIYRKDNIWGIGWEEPYPYFGMRGREKRDVEKEEEPQPRRSRYADLFAEMVREGRMTMPALVSVCG